MRSDLPVSGRQIDIVAAARRLAPQIVAAREEAEQMRQTPATLARALADAGLYQMFLPRSVGGMEVTPLVAFEAIEELSKADGSVGWCAMIASDVAMITGWLPTETLRKMVGSPADFRAAGSLRPQGKAWPVDGGYRVKGQWNFASGIINANWLYCPTVVMDGEKPQLTPAGTPKVRAMWLPIKEARIIDTWQTIGLRGTGSHDFIVDDAFVPEDRSCFIAEPPVEKGALYNQRLFLVALWVTTAGNALGIARGAIDTFVDIALRDALSVGVSPR